MGQITAGRRQGRDPSEDADSSDLRLPQFVQHALLPLPGAANPKASLLPPFQQVTADKLNADMHDLLDSKL